MRHRQAGVTLMELLIAVSLVSLLSLGVLLAMRVGLDALQKTNSKFLQTRRVLGAQRILEQQIANLIPVIGECAPSPVAPGQKIQFFQGEMTAMRFVTSFSMEEGARGYPRIVEFAVIPGDNGEGVRLVVNEILYTGAWGTRPFCAGIGPDPTSGRPMPRFLPVQAGPRSFVLADKLASCRFLFKELRGLPPVEQWVPRWPWPELPLAIRVELVPARPDPSRLLVVPVTAQVLVTREPVKLYAD